MSRSRTLALVTASVTVIACLVVGVALGTDAGGRKAATGKTGFVQGKVATGDKAEAGVWVIAETADLPTPYRKIVVTNDQGRFVVPELPEADYDVWVRGYGLRDSAKVPVTVSRTGSRAPIAISTEVATPQEDARNYPANYWLSLFEPPADTESLPGGRDQHTWMSQFKLSCQLCHQMGATRTRGLRGDRQALDTGLQKARSMNGPANGLGRDALLDQLADWGAKNLARTPPQPPRPAGIERNFVITQWAWGDLYTYAHDQVATDKRNPKLYPNGKIWGVDLGNDRLLSVDPVTHEAEAQAVPTLPGHDLPWCDQPGFASLGCPVAGIETPHLGAYDNPANPHNPMMDDTGKVWMTTQIRHGNDHPAFCTQEPGPNAEPRSPSTLPTSGHRQLGYYDTKTKEFVLINTCFGTHHLQFDDEGVLWLSGDSRVIGWFDPSKFDPAQPETAQDAQGWSRVEVDSDGDGQKDTPVGGFNYGIIPNPADGTVWTARPGGGPNGRTEIVRYDPATDMHEVYEPPAPGFGARGVDVDTEGNIWVALGGSGHLAKFDRSKCAQTWGLGDQCPEGWTLYQAPGPEIDTGEGPENVTSADFHYYLWTDLFNTLGMGKDTVILNGTGSDSLLAFDPKTEKFSVIRVPYPLNLFTRGLDGRIDDPGAGWKGRGLWFDNGADPVLHSEIPQSYVGHVQLRPNPLAR
jgi:streptogramin lyase